MRVEDCYWVGEIRKAHGIKGEVKAYFDVHYLEEYLDMESVYLLNEDKLIPFFINKMRAIGPNLAILSLRDIVTRNDAEAINGYGMYLPLDQLPELAEGQFYYHDVIGFTVEDKSAGVLGEVKEFREMPAHDLMVMRYKGADVLIPVTKEFVIEADSTNKKIITNLPEGLVEVYI